MSRHNPMRAEAAVQRSTEAVYGRWAPIYDLIFDLPFHPGRLAAARAAGEAAGVNGELLVVGVGTGLELGIAAQERARHRHRSERADAQDRARPGRAAGAGPGQVVAGDGRRRAGLRAADASTSRSRPM